METFIEYIKNKALTYWNETADDTEQITSFPTSIVDFVVEYAVSCCHFPSHFTEENIVAELSNCKNSIAMACVDVYSRAGAEGELSHSENGVSRTYSDAWISKTLLDKLPNYVKIFS